VKTTVVNLYKEPFDCYIGRASSLCGPYCKLEEDGYFGNPFRIGGRVSREDAVSAFREYFAKRIEEDSEFRRRVLELKGKRLGCYCVPLACHGDVIAQWLDGSESEDYQNCHITG